MIGNSYRYIDHVYTYIIILYTIYDKTNIFYEIKNVN